MTILWCCSLLLLLGCAAPQPLPSADPGRSWLPALVPGTTRIAELGAALGSPTCTFGDDGIHVWQLLLVEDAEPLSQNALTARLAARQEEGAWRRVQQTGRLITLRPDESDRLWALSRIEEYSLVVVERNGVVARATLIRFPP